jgi:alcohol dehydrogenase class IV
MSLIVCSPSTQNFLEGEKFIVNNPPTKDILQLQGKYGDVIAIGGGAVIDTAKILSNNPIVCYPTTAAGATATSHSVYWDGNNKLNFHSYIPKETKFESKFIKSLPENTLQYTKYDAISHCLDILWSKDINKLNKTEVEDTLKKLTDPKIKPIDVIKLGHKAGTFIQIVPTTILHALSYPITGKYGITHGKALGFLIPPLCRIFKQKINIKKLNKFVDIDVNFIIDKAQTYNKFFNTEKSIDLNILNKELNYEKNKLLN